MNLVSRLVREAFTVSRFTLIGLLATATHAVVGSATVLLGVTPLLANAVGFVVAWGVSFYGHFLFTFGRPNDIRVARTRFIVISLSLFAISQLTVTLLQATGWVSDWLEPVIGAVIVPPASYVLYRLYVFAPDSGGAAAPSRSPGVAASWRPGDLRRQLWHRLQSFLWIHRIVIPFGIFALFFDLSTLNPQNVGWLMGGDLGQHFLGWTAYRFGSWQWPVGFSELIAHPTGAPLSATDSNPLVSVPLKLMSPLLPDYFQYVGLWYLACLALSYNIAFGLLYWLSGRWLASMAAAIILVAAPFMFTRLEHDSLMAHWLVLLSFSVFFRTGADRRAVAKHGGVTAVAMAIHPYLIFMTGAVAAMDLVRRTYRRFIHGAGLRALGFFAAGIATLLIPAALVGWLLGIFALQPLPQNYGVFTMDPLAWFNGFGQSATLTGWQSARGQYEGNQFLGLGALIAVVVAMVLWVTGMARPSENLRTRLPWLLPAMLGLLLLAVSPVVHVFGLRILSVNVDDWPLIGYVFETFRSSGRFAWPVSYLLVLVSLSIWLTIRSRAVGPLLALLAVVQLADQLPVMSQTREVTRFRDVEFKALQSEQDWRRLVAAADRLYVDPSNRESVIFELGYLAFPQHKPINHFHYAQQMLTAKHAAALRSERARIMQGQISDSVLYVLDPILLTAVLRRQGVSPDRLRDLDGFLVIGPPDVSAGNPPGVRFRLAPDSDGLHDIVASCRADCSVLLSVRDEATASLSPEFISLIEERGGDLGALPVRGSYAAILANGRVIEEALSATGDVRLNATVFGHDVGIFSGGAVGSNRSSIKLDGYELSPNTRGINLVVLGPDGVSDINAFDTHADPSRSLFP